MWLLFAFILVPLAELWAIGEVASGIGLGWTLLLLLADSVIGAVLVKREGRRAWAKFRQTIGEGKWPGDEVAQGGLLLIGGALLLTPGFLTDLVGLLLVLPPTRAMAAAVVKRRIVPVPIQVAGSAYNHARSGGDPRDVFDGMAGQDRPRRDRDRRSGPTDVFDVEVVSVERDEPDQLGPASDR